MSLTADSPLIGTPTMTVGELAETHEGVSAGAPHAGRAGSGGNLQLGFCGTIRCFQLGRPDRIGGSPNDPRFCYVPWPRHHLPKSTAPD